MSFEEGSGYMLGGADGFMLGGAEKVSKKKVSKKEGKKTVKNIAEYAKMKKLTKGQLRMSDIVKSLSESKKLKYQQMMKKILKEHPKKSLESRRKLALGMLGYDGENYHIPSRVKNVKESKKTIKKNIDSKLNNEEKKVLHKLLKSIGLGYQMK